MRKIFKLTSGRKGKFSLVALLALILVGGFSLSYADDVSLNSNFTVEYSGTGIKYNFTAPSTGVLKVTLKPASGYSGVNYGEQGETQILYTSSNAAVPSISNNGTDVGAPFLTNVTEATFNVTEGQSYYVKFPYWAGTCLLSMGDDSGDNGGGGDSGEGGGDVVTGGTLQLGINYDAPVSGTITFPSDGVLTVKYNEDGDAIFQEIWDSILFTDASCTNEVEATGIQGGSTYKVNANTTYYVKAEVASESIFGAQVGPGAPLGYQFGLVLSFNESDDKPSVEPGETPQGYEWMPVIVGPVSSPTQEVQITSDGVFYYFKPTTDGKLTIWQWGGSKVDPHLWYVPFDGTNWEPYSYLVPNEQGMDNPNPQDLVYGLDAGTEYYFYANKGQGITYACFVWEPKDTNTIPVIPEGVPTFVSKAGGLAKYIPAEDGVLYADFDVFNTGVASIPSQQNFFFTNSGHSDKVPALSVVGGTSGWQVKFEVTGGKTYYVYNDTQENFTITMNLHVGEEIESRLVDVQPLPGGVANDDNESTLTIQFDPSDVEVESIDFVYTDTSGQLQTIKNIWKGFSFGAYNVARPKFMTLDGQLIDQAATQETVLSHISKEIGAVQQYVLHNVNRNGVYVTKSDITDGVEFDNGNIILKYSVDVAPTLVNAVYPDPFYKSWEAGDPAGIMVLTYDKELNESSVVEVQIIEGAQYYGSEPAETDRSWTINESKIKVSGKTLTVDFTGPDAILPTVEADGDVETSYEFAPSKSTITLFVGGLKGANNLLCQYDGNPAYMPHVSYVSEEAPEPEPVVADIVAVTPHYGEVIYVEEDGTSSFQIEFNQDVQINWVGTYNRMNRQHATTYETNPAYGEFAKVWTVIIPAKDIEEAMRDNDENASIFAYVEAKDKDGEIVQGSNTNPTADQTNRVDNNGDSFTLWFNVEHAENPGMPFTTSLENGDNEAPLRSFTVASDWGTLDGNNSEFADENGLNFNPFTGITVTGEDFEATAESFDYSTQSVILSTPILKEGVYTINFPFMAFTIVAPEEDGISKTYYTEEKTVEFTVVLGDKIYDSQVDHINLTTEPAHSESEVEAEAAEPVATDQITNINLTWNDRNLEIVEDEDGGVTVTGPNGYFADYADDAHQYSIVDGNKFVLNLEGIIAEISELINSQAQGMDASAYNGVYRFTIKKNTIRIDGSNNARAIEEPVYNDEAYLFYNLNFADAVAYEEQLIIDDMEFYPAADVNYYFTPYGAGTLKLEVYYNGEPTSTYIMGGLYDASGALVDPSDSDSFIEFGMTKASYLEYDNLTPGSKYYFTWTKNGGGDQEYVLYATWTESEIEQPEAPANTLILDKEWYPVQGQAYYYTPTENGYLMWKLINGKTYWMGDVLTDYVSGNEITPSQTDITNGLAADTFNNGSYANYPLQAGTTYVFTWPKDNDQEEYPQFHSFVTDIPTFVAGIEAADGVYRVYNLQGVNVLNTENATDLNGLAKGLYIVNGKKLLVK